MKKPVRTNHRKALKDAIRIWEKARLRAAAARKTQIKAWARVNKLKAGDAARRSSRNKSASGQCQWKWGFQDRCHRMSPLQAAGYYLCAQHLGCFLRRDSEERLRLVVAADWAPPTESVDEEAYLSCDATPQEEAIFCGPCERPRGHSGEHDWEILAGDIVWRMEVKRLQRRHNFDRITADRIVQQRVEEDYYRNFPDISIYKSGDDDWPVLPRG